ncbi:hypothetical protein ACHWQZ_G015789 [Mnemiopsis leidyi]
MTLDIPILGAHETDGLCTGKDCSGFGRGTHFLFGCLTVIFFLIGVPGGTISLLYFLRKKNKTINTHLFILINITDISICLLMVFVGISHFAHGDSLIFGNSTFCNLWAMFWQIAIRVSVFLVGMLSITRVISILKPIYIISVTKVLLPIAVYAIFISVQSTVPLWLNSKYNFRPSLSRCTWNSTEYLKCSAGDTIYSTLHMLVEWSLPVIPVLVSCIVLVYKLQCKVMLKMPTAGHRNSVTSNTGLIKRESTITIVILTAVYLVCSTSSAIFHFGYYFDYLLNCGEETRFADELDPVVLTLLTTFAIPLNSTLNTIIYFCRIRDLRTFALSALRIFRLRSIYRQEAHAVDTSNKFDMQPFHGK